ncbi:MAG: cation diffusion facilitator family transporter [Pseudomonadota bacterium]
MSSTNLTNYAWLSIGAAIITMALKGMAYGLTGSVGLLSDAVESVVNLIGASIALAMLTIASRPADEEHMYGHAKAEYFASGAEGALILLAALSIGYAAVSRLITPRPIEQAGAGLAVSTIASLINLAVARVLLRAGKKNNSITLEADAQHLMTDVWTSAGVIAGIIAVAVTGWQALDPLVALAVAMNIIWSGYRLITRSVAGLMDAALPAEELAAVVRILNNNEKQGIQYHALRTRQAAAHRFISVHVLVPGTWTVDEGHQMLEQLEHDIRKVLSNVTVISHLEPRPVPEIH